VDPRDNPRVRQPSGNSQSRAKRRNLLVSTPTVTATNPANRATAVNLNQAIGVTFSQPMSVPSVGSNFIVLRPGGGRVSGAVNVQGTSAVFTPSVNLLPNTTYAGKIRAAASDATGVAMGLAYLWTFTTGASSDTTKPTVTFTDPADAAVSVPINQRINAMFSEAMVPHSLNRKTFKPGFPFSQ
jgi:Big-like domain-containing protein